MPRTRCSNVPVSHAQTEKAAGESISDSLRDTRRHKGPTGQNGHGSCTGILLEQPKLPHPCLTHTRTSSQPGKGCLRPSQESAVPRAPWAAAGFGACPAAPGPHSHLMLKEALAVRASSPVSAFLARHWKAPASRCRSTAVNCRLLPSLKRCSVSWTGCPSCSHWNSTPSGSFTSQRRMAPRPCRASCEYGSLVKRMLARAPTAAAHTREGTFGEREGEECIR